jgi:hypothetical protein
MKATIYVAVTCDAPTAYRPTLPSKSGSNTYGY